MKIISSNLDPAKNAFLEEELGTVLALARARGVNIPDGNIRLHAENPEKVRPDDRPFADYLERKRHEQSYRLEGFTVYGGGYPGVLYGFYALLRRELNVGFHGITEEDIHFYRRRMPGSDVAAPRVVLRGINGLFTIPERLNDPSFLKRFMLFMARNQWNMILCHAKFWIHAEARHEILDYAGLCGIEWVTGGHSMEVFLPESLFEEHPEYFGMREGKRCLKGPVFTPDLGVTVTSPIQPCFSNPDTCSRIARNIADYLEKYPESDIFSLWPHDGANNFCDCPECRALTPYDQMLRLAEAVLLHAPRPVYLELLAYCALLNVPPEPRRQERSYTLFCPYLRHYETRFDAPHPAPESLRLGNLYPEPEPVNPDDDRDYGILWNRWTEYLRKSRGTAGVFAYYQLAFYDVRGIGDRIRYLRYPPHEQVVAELDRFMADGMQVYYDCSCPYPGFWPDASLYTYHSQRLFSPGFDAREAVARYEEEVLGEAAGPLLAICRALDRGDRELPPALFERLDHAAEQLADSRGERLKVWGKYVRLITASRRAFCAGDADALRAAEEAAIALFDHHAECLENHLETGWMKRISQSALRHGEKRSNILA